MRQTLIVIPCYNEGERLSPEGFRALLDDPGVRLLFVNDGSTDNTLALVQGFAAEQPAGRVSVLNLTRNSGKGEAVRGGLRFGLEQHQGLEWIGYVDADLATPAPEILRLIELAGQAQAQVIMGSRVRLLGSHVERNPIRHYLGRIFATLASLSIGLAVYDTQCGAKFFKLNQALSMALAEPFPSRWIFDVELIQRLLRGGLVASDFLEVPLRRWVDVRGSKLGFLQMLGAGKDLLLMALRRKRVGESG